MGNTLWLAFSNTSTPGMHLGWTNVDPAIAGSDDNIIDVIIQNKAWVVVVGGRMWYPVRDLFSLSVFSRGQRNNEAQPCSRKRRRLV